MFISFFYSIAFYLVYVTRSSLVIENITLPQCPEKPEYLEDIRSLKCIVSLPTKGCTRATTGINCMHSTACNISTGMYHVESTTTFFEPASPYQKHIFETKYY